MAVLISGTPTRGCRCEPCRQARARIFARLTDPQRACFDACDRVRPRHTQDVKDRARVTRATIQSLVSPRRAAMALITEVRLGRFTRGEDFIPFLLLTDLGRDVANPRMRA